MTARFHSLTVVLEDDTRDDDARTIMDAIAALRGVADVSGVVSDPVSHMAEVRARQELGKKVVDLVYGEARQ
jgi:hypothetical protein